MNRLSALLLSLKGSRRKALSFFVTCGFPNLQGTVPLVLALEQSGADFIELGIPFSDPIADGPTIQWSSAAALQNGVTLQKTLVIVAEIRKQSQMPLILMGYVNPILAYGLELFIKQAAEAGADGLIIPDISLEESSEYRSLASQHGIAAIFLAAPTTPDDRLRLLDQSSTGFIYCVSVSGVTGARKNIALQAEAFLRRARTCVTRNPIMVGFGIGSPDDARLLAPHADGLVIGSALIEILRDHATNDSIGHVASFARSIRHALDSVPS